MEAKTADLTLAYGSSMLKHHLKGKRAQAVGNPLFDAASRKKAAAKPAHPPKNILIGTLGICLGDINCQYSCSEQYIIDVLHALQASSSRDLNITIKIHPAENLSFYRWLLNKQGFDRVKIIAGGDIQAIMSDYDLVIMPHSVSLFEAALMGLPVVFYLPTKQIMSEPYDGFKHLPTAFTKAELIQVLSQALADKHYAYSFTSSEVLEPFTGPVDGQAGQRIATIINELVGVGSET
jgi:hypothetical protein